MTRMWNIDHPNANTRCVAVNAPCVAVIGHVRFNDNSDNKIKINSPAYKLPKSRKANDTGFANNPTLSKTKLNGIMTG